MVPVGVDLRRIGPLRQRSGPVTFLWNHRWDPDKALEEALEASVILAGRGLDFRVVLAGEPFVDQPEEYREAIDALGDRVVHRGYLDEAGYIEALHAADVVVSTAHQEFFGVSVVEAMYAGALPVLPDRLVVPGAGTGRVGGAVACIGIPENSSIASPQSPRTRPPPARSPERCGSRSHRTTGRWWGLRPMPGWNPWRIEALRQPGSENTASHHGVRPRVPVGSASDSQDDAVALAAATAECRSADAAALGRRALIRVTTMRAPVAPRGGPAPRRRRGR